MPRTAARFGAVLCLAVLAMVVISSAPIASGPAAATTPIRVDSVHPTGLAPPASGVRGSIAVASVGWVDAGPPAAPPGLFYPSLATDPYDGYVVLFGGCTAVICSSPSNATWEYALGHWTQLYPVHIPPARTEAVMVYDAADHYVLMYGGQGSHGALTDTWSFRGGEWTQVVTRTNPGDRVDASMAFDSADGYALLFGGSACNATCGTWTYRGGAWSSLNTSGLPPARYGAAIAYDVSLGKVLLFGGTSSGGSILGDTWEYLAGAWNPLGSGPPQRSDASMAYDSVIGAVILFGGEYITLSNFPGVTYNDTWEYGATGWSQLATSGGAPAEYEGAMAMDPQDGSDVLIGGCGPSGCPGSVTWLFGAETPVTISTVPATCGSVAVAAENHANGAVIDLPVGVYAVSASPCAHYTLAAINGSGGVVTDYAGDAANVSSEGAIVATFAPMTYAVTVEVVPASCGAIQFGTTTIAPGATQDVDYGPYAAIAPSCTGEQFSAWSTSGHNLSITGADSANTSIEVAGNGTLTATFTPAPASASSPGGTVLGLPALVWVAIVAAIAIVAVALVASLSRRRRAPPISAWSRSPSPPPE